MSMTPAQHQKRLDDSAAIKSLQESIEAEMREELLAGRYIEIRYRRNVAIVKEVYDRDNAVDAMIDLDSDGFNEAVMMIGSGKGQHEGRAILESLWPRAVEQVIGLAKTWEAAVYEFYEAERKVA